MRIRTISKKEYNKAYSKTYNGPYYEANKDKFRLNRIKWDENNHAKTASWKAKRKALKLQRTPKWLTKSQLELIEFYYHRAAYLTEVTGIKWEVDHIIPLQGKNVSGLHVPWNLRVITKEENCRKNNRVGLQLSL